MQAVVHKVTGRDSTAPLRERVEAWLARDPDPRTREELQALVDTRDESAIAERFAGRLAFGTAGLRGVVGAGPARMNRLVVQETTAGLARYLDQCMPGSAERGVVVTYDARPDSKRFAADATCVLAGAGFRVYLTDDCQPTPVGAFAVPHLGAAAGVVVTASHNPPRYNGYKVYWDNGAQIIPPHDAGIAREIDLAAERDIPWMDFDQALQAGRLEVLGTEFTDAYCERVAEVCGGYRRGEAARIRLAYTAMHGVGAKIATRLLASTGWCETDSVENQHQPDGSFPTVAFPNPEEPGAMDEVLALARSREAELACANDPDADRLAAAVRDRDGEYQILTGDQVGVLLADYVLSRQPRGFTPIVCTSIVSSRMLESLAEASGAAFFETLTGFKWLANVALGHEDDGHRFVYAYEEALGYALGEAVHDKDGLSALLVFAQMAAELAAREETVLDRLASLYRRHGLYATEQRSIATGSGNVSITGALRGSVPAEIAGRPVVSVKDLGERRHRFADGRVEALDMPAADVLMYYLADASRVIVRPSGTEPKVKCYYEVVRQIAAGEGVEAARREAGRSLAALADRHQAELAALLE